jgi:hypothetical protein
MARSQEEVPHQNSILSSSLQIHEKINFYYLSHPFYGILLGLHPKVTDIDFYADSKVFWNKYLKNVDKILGLDDG